MSSQSNPSLFHLQPNPFPSLPPHPSLPNSPASPALHTFILSALKEANTFISSTVPQTFKVDKKLRSSPPSKAKVELSSATIHVGSGPDDGEYWVSRRSVHGNAAEPGTASFEEFVRGLRDDHTENEMKYTPSVSNVEKILEWDCEIDGGFEDDGWKDVKMAVTGITHTFNPSFLISPRTFLVLVLIASLPPPRTKTSTPTQQSPGFITLQVPLSHHNLQNLAPSITLKRAPGIFAHYASIEKVTLLPPIDTDGESSASQGRIEWRTATTSDAGGWIPKRVQRSWHLGGVPRAVVQDVGLFMAWVDRGRKEQEDGAFEVHI